MSVLCFRVYKTKKNNEGSGWWSYIQRCTRHLFYLFSQTRIFTNPRTFFQISSLSALFCNGMTMYRICYTAITARYASFHVFCEINQFASKLQKNCVFYDDCCVRYRIGQTHWETHRRAKGFRGVEALLRYIVTYFALWCIEGNGGGSLGKTTSAK